MMLENRTEQVDRITKVSTGYFMCLFVILVVGFQTLTFDPAELGEMSEMADSRDARVTQLILV